MSVYAEAGFADNADIAELYRALAKPLEQIVRLDVWAPDPVIEDACQFAWGRLIHHRDHIRRETALAWLVTTAVREAVKLLRRDRRCVSLDATLELGGEARLTHEVPAVDVLHERRERLAAVRELPERHQRILWLHALGLTYAEIALHTGCSTRTVERQLLRAKRALREAGE